MTNISDLLVSLLSQVVENSTGIESIQAIARGYVQTDIIKPGAYLGGSTNLKKALQKELVLNAIEMHEHKALKGLSTARLEIGGILSKRAYKTNVCLWSAAVAPMVGIPTLLLLAGGNLFLPMAGTLLVVQIIFFLFYKTNHQSQVALEANYLQLKLFEARLEMVGNIDDPSVKKILYEQLSIHLLSDKKEAIHMTINNWGQIDKIATVGKIKGEMNIEGKP